MSNFKKINLFLIILTIICNLYSLFLLIQSGNYDRIEATLVLFPLVIVGPLIRKLGFKINDYLELIYLIFLFLALYLGSIVNLYSTVAWYDVFAHTLTGIVISFLAIFILNKSKPSKSLFFNLLFIIGLVSLVSIVWEIYEYSWDMLTGEDLQHVIDTGINDTMQDLIAAISGSVLFIILYVMETKTKKGIIINRFLTNIKKAE